MEIKYYKGGNMNIHLNVNDLVEQLVELTKHQNEAMVKVKNLSEELREVKDKLMMKELEEYKQKLEYENDLDQMAKKHEATSNLENSLDKIVNG